MIKEETLKPKLRFSEFKELWPSDILSNLVTDGFRNGYSPNSPTTPTGRFVLSLSAISANGFNVSGVKYAPDTIEVLRTELKSGDFLVSRSNTRNRVGLSAMFRGELERCSYPDLLIRFRPNSQIHPEYLEQTLKSFRVLKYLQSSAAGTSGSMVKITGKIIGNALIPLPSLPEQRKIADFLTAVDGRIGQLIQKKALLEDYKKGVMQQLFTQAIRFKDEHGNDFPEWEEKKLGKLGRLYQPKTISQTDLTPEGFTVYGANGIIGKYHSFNHEKPQVTVTCRGTTCGVIGYSEPHSWITGNAMVVNLDECLDSTKMFVFHALRATDLRYFITGSGQPQITGNLKGHTIGYPSHEEQTKIADFLSALDRKIESVANQITQTKTFKQGLLQQLFV